MRGTKVVEPDSELARMIESAGAGRQADPLDVSAITATIRDLGRDPERLRTSRVAAANLYRDRFSRERQLEEWARLFRDLRPVEAT